MMAWGGRPGSGALLSAGAIVLAAAVAAIAAKRMIAGGITRPNAATPSRTGGYPVRPKPLPAADEVAIAMSAAPRAISGKATIWILTAAGPAKARDGTNGCTCMVSRDLHQGSLYPMCFDQEGTRSSFRQELLELSLRFEGRSEQEVKDSVAHAYAVGRLRLPSMPTIAYMMSPRQVLFSSPDREGQWAGAWHPHIMIALPYATGEQFGLARGSHLDFLSVDRSGEAGAALIVQMLNWADSASHSSHASRD